METPQDISHKNGNDAGLTEEFANTGGIQTCSKNTIETLVSLQTSLRKEDALPSVR